MCNLRGGFFRDRESFEKGDLSAVSDHIAELLGVGQNNETSGISG